MYQILFQAFHLEKLTHIEVKQRATHLKRMHSPTWQTLVQSQDFHDLCSRSLIMTGRIQLREQILEVLTKRATPEAGEEDKCQERVNGKEATRNLWLPFF